MAIRSLSSRLLVLTVAFVMIAEVLIFVPSIARFRENWMEEKLGLGHLAILALDATPDRMVSEMLRKELLDQVGAYGLFVRRGGARLVLSGEMPPPVAESFNVGSSGMLPHLRDTFMTLWRTEDRVVRIVGPSPKDASVTIEVVVDEAPLRQAMIGFGWRILGLSIFISLITATLVYLALNWLLVRPMRRITANMVAFREDPEDATRVINPSPRQDEIGTAQRELAGMQTRLRATLKQRSHLAALGTAVAKVNHDLRGILASALLISDRLSAVDDPEVRRVTPTLFASIERAVKLCSQTLDFVGQDQPDVSRSRFPLRTLVEDVGNDLASTEEDDASLENLIPAELELEADRDQLFRILNNLVRNASQAGAMSVSIDAATNGRWVRIDVADNGPGLPPRARAKLFQPFEGSVRAGGTGLGLAIARELVRNHGGDLELVESGAEGTVFRIELPLM
ncbi:MAG: HAMP domain-containing histidine kinase [Alphaproteobacteria bacterium]|nr:HAMP domain-containing histidine kinase [Alphaproteobacteria bacterium]